MPLTRDPTGRALLGGLALDTILGRSDVSTPFYAYDVDAVVAEAAHLQDGFDGAPSLVCYAVKANSAGRILRRLAHAGVGADIVSGGELDVCLGAGIPADRIVWSGVAKTDAELDRGIAAGLLSLHVESVEELGRILARASALCLPASVSLRVNPSVEVDTHANIATGHDEAKFGIAADDLPAALALLEGQGLVTLVGLSSHVGSQMRSTTSYVEAATTLARLARQVRAAGHTLTLLDLGGGMGIDYGDGCDVAPADFVCAASAAVRREGVSDLRLLCEPGRAMVGAHGVLVARTIQTKRWKGRDTVGWLFVDAGMNDLARPALYGARHRIEPLVEDGTKAVRWKVAGPVCESTDDFGVYDLPDPPPGAVVIRDAGAYGYTMAGQYNGRPLASEVFVEGGIVTSIATESTAAAWAVRRLAT